MLETHFSELEALEENDKIQISHCNQKRILKTLSGKFSRFAFQKMFELFLWTTIQDALVYLRKLLASHAFMYSMITTRRGSLSSSVTYILNGFLKVLLRIMALQNK
jgi:hypothetical protein